MTTLDYLCGPRTSPGASHVHHKAGGLVVPRVAKWPRLWILPGLQLATEWWVNRFTTPSARQIHFKAFGHVVCGTVANGLVRRRGPRLHQFESGLSEIVGKSGAAFCFLLSARH